MSVTAVEATVVADMVVEAVTTVVEAVTTVVEEAAIMAAVATTGMVAAGEPSS